MLASPTVPLRDTREPYWLRHRYAFRPVAIRVGVPIPQLIFRFPNGWGASVIGEIDFTRVVGGAPFWPTKDDEVELVVVTWDHHDDPDTAYRADRADPVSGGQPLRMLPVASVDAVLHSIARLPDSDTPDHLLD